MIPAAAKTRIITAKIMGVALFSLAVNGSLPSAKALRHPAKAIAKAVQRLSSMPVDLLNFFISFISFIR